MSLGKDYIMRSIFEQAPVTFVPASGKLSGVCTREHYIILYEFLNDFYNINSIIIYDELKNIVSVCSKKSCSLAVYLMPYCLARCGEWIWCREWILHW